jgi:hypothetical protein
LVRLSDHPTAEGVDLAGFRSLVRPLVRLADQGVAD